MSTLEQLKAEADRAAEALRAAQQTERDTAKAAERERQRAAEALRAAAAAVAITAELAPVRDALIQSGWPEARIQDSTILLSATQCYGRFRIEREAVHSRGSRFSYGHITGAKVVVGSYGDKKIFPRRQDGTFNAEAIAEEITRRYASELAAAAQEALAKQKLASAASLAASLKAELNSNMIEASVSYSNNRDGRYLSTAHAAPDGKVYFCAGSRLVTPAQARILAAAFAQVAEMEVQS